MTYKFVAREDLEDAKRMAYLNGCAPLWLVAERLLAERDAYREVAIGWVISETKTRSRSEEDCIRDVDAEAARILEGKK